MIKKLALISGLLLATVATLLAATADELALTFVRTVIQKSGHAERGSLDALRYFQFTATTPENNPNSYVLTSKDAQTESGFMATDKSVYVSALKDRSSARILRLWQGNKKALLSSVPKSRYVAMAKDEIDGLLAFRASAGYSKAIAAMRKKSPKLDAKTVDVAGEITEYSNYKELAFWYRRTVEGNDRVVHDILKEISKYYK